MRRHLLLAGFMASGKTTVGRLAAPLLDLPFVDTDIVFTERLGLKPFDFIKRFGIRSFRKTEKRIVRELLHGRPSVIATGGGAVLDDANRALMRRLGCVVWLQAPIRVLARRIGLRPGLPDYFRPVSVEKIGDLLRERVPFYRQSHARAMTHPADPKEVAIQITRLYKQFCSWNLAGC